MAEVFDFGLQQHKIKMDGKFFESNLFAVAGDTGRRLEVQLLDSDNMIQNTTGISLRLNANVAGKATYAEATLVDATKGLYELDLPNGMLIAPGNWQFQWQIIGATGEKLHSFAFVGSIGSNLSEGGTEATNFYLNLEDLKQMQEDFISGAFDSSVLETNLAEKLNNLEEQYAPKLTEVTVQLAKKATINYVDALLMDIAKGGPKGFFNSKATLLSTYPTGTTGTWLVFDSSFTDGAHSFMWDSINSVWKDLGVYQATGIREKSVEYMHTTFLTPSLKDLMINDLYKTGTLSVAGDFYDVGTGKLINNDYTQVYKNTGRIDITKNATYKVKCINSIVFYTATGVFISSWQYNTGETGDVFNYQKLPIPSNASYMIGNINNQFWRTSPAPTGTPSLIETIPPLYFKDLKVYEENLSKEVKDLINSDESRFKGKTIVNLGDSIIENKNPSVSEFIVADLGAAVINGGFGGCMMCPHPNAEYAKFSMTAIAEAIATGNWSLQKNATGVPASFKTTVAILEALNWSDVDIITISYGTNDWLNSNLLDNSSNLYDTASYLGALRHSIRKLRQTYPKLKILVTAPIYRSTDNRLENAYNWRNGNQLRIIEFVDGLDKIRRELAVPIADTFFGLGINQWNESYYFPANDGTHPNAFGRELLGQKIANSIKNAY